MDTTQNVLDITQQLFQSALALPESNRVELAEMLLESVDAASGEDVESAWADEIKHRLDEIDRGEVKMIPWEKFSEELKQRRANG